jgi:curved DNA-binding protein
MSAAADFYAELCIDKGASSEEIKRAFRKLARTCHPDVAKDDPAAADKFGRIREAYETLVDPARRARYDQRGQKRTVRRGGQWRPPGGWAGFSARSRARQGGGSRKAPSMDLEDIFSDHSETTDFGFGGRASSGGSSAQQGRPDKGRTIEMSVNTPARVARLGGTVTVRYPRMRRSSDGVNVYRYNEIHDLRVPPRTCTGDVLKVERMGDSGGTSGRYGDLICKINVVEAAPRPSSVHVNTHQPGPVPSPEPSPPPAPEPAPARPPEADRQPKDETLVVMVSVVEAILGGRIEVPTAKGMVRLSIPPGSSGGTRLRLKGRGAEGGDLYVVLRIEVPRRIDVQSRALIERFAELNPAHPHDDS